MSFGQPDDGQTLLGSRFLCRGGALLLVGSSGIGKSSASIQQDILWALGRSAFGIRPIRPLKILAIQAEDDPGDIYEMREGVLDHLALTNSEIQVLGDNYRIVDENARSGDEFLKFLRIHLEKARPDLLRINPLQAYVGGDVKDMNLVSSFLRNGINPLLREFRCGLILVHHTPKTNFRTTEEWKGSDWMYAGAGSADITNWARAVIVIDSVKDNRATFKWIAAKRGNRIGWVDDDNHQVVERYFSHSTNSIVWKETDPHEIADVEATKKKDKKSGQFTEKYTETDILERMDIIEARKTGRIRKDVMDNSGMSKRQFYYLWSQLREQGKITESEAGWRKLV